MASTVTMELPLPPSPPPPEGTGFSLELAVCSHGLFMMAPNVWDPLSRSLLRPLRLASGQSIAARISQTSPSALLISLSYSSSSVSPQDRDAIVGQVQRMLRLSEMEELSLRGFHKVHLEARACGFGRIFRSPTLFEDMVKCILFCNCQWPRSLSMAEALCELQLELQASKNHKYFQPMTPQPSERKRKRGNAGNISVNLATRFTKTIEKPLEDPQFLSCRAELPNCSDSQNSSHNSVSEVNPDSHKLLEHATSNEFDAVTKVGNFPTPEELASIDVDYLAKRCKLGYRAPRIVLLSRGIVEGKIDLKKIETSCGQFEQGNYDELDNMLSAVSGFGPFTRANVLMCMGFFHKIPADTETIRHLKKFHNVITNIKSVSKDLEKIYGKYEPYQFMAYWFELWGFYDKQFGKISELQPSHYKLFTAHKLDKNAAKMVSL